MYRLLAKNFGGERTYIIADEVTGRPQNWPDGINVVRVNRERLDSLGLRADLRDSGWRCGDYCQAALFDEVPEADRMWMFENDLGFSRFTPKGLVDIFADDDADYVSWGVGPLSSEGFWAGTLNTRGFVGQEWHSFYPLTRTTRAASEAAVRLRRRVQYVPSPLMQPNDETVMASAVAEAALSSTRLEEKLPFTLRRFSPGRPAPFWLLAALYRGPQIFHPVGPLRRRQRRTPEEVTAPQN